MLKRIIAGVLTLSLGFQGYAWHQVDAPMESGWYPGSFGVSQAWIAQGWDSDFEERNGKEDAGRLHFLAMRPSATAAEIQGLLAKGFSLSARTREGATPLHYAARYNDNPAVLRTLIRLGADPNARDREGRTPLHYAARWNVNPAVLRTLVALGAKVDARDAYGETPLLHAAENLTAVFLTLLELGADPSARTRDGSGLLEGVASRTANPLILGALLDRLGCEGHRCDRLLIGALWDPPRGHPSPAVLDLVLRRGADVHYPGTPDLDVTRRLAWEVAFGKAADHLPFYLFTLCRYGYAPGSAGEKAWKRFLHGLAGNGSQPYRSGLLLPAYTLFTGRTFCADYRLGDPDAALAESLDPWLYSPELALLALQHGARPKGVPRVFVPYEDYSCTPVCDHEPALRFLWTLLSYGADLNERDEKGETALHHLAHAAYKEAGHSEYELDGPKILLYEVLGLGADPNVKSKSGEYPLYLAMTAGDWPEFKTRVLLEAGADPNRIDGRGRNALHYWAISDPQPLERLIEFGLDVKNAINRKDADGRTPLLLLLRAGNAPAYLDRLLALGADPRAVDRFGRGAVLNAVIGQDDPKVLERLASLGLRADRVDQRGRGALICYLDPEPCLDDPPLWPTHRTIQGDALSPPDLGVIERLVAMGADPLRRDARGRLPIHAFLRARRWPRGLGEQGYARLLELLLPPGTDPDVRDAEGWTPLGLALRGGAPEVLIQRLLARGADPNARLPGGGNSLHAWASSFRAGLDILRALLARGADPNARDDQGRTVYHVLRGHAEVLSTLLAFGFDPRVLDREGRSLLHYPSPTIGDLRTLLDLGLDPNRHDRWGLTPLHDCNSEACVEALVERGADPNARDRFGETPLFDVPWSLVDALLRRGARLDARNDLGATALHAALGVTKVKILLKRGLSPNLRDRYGNTPLHLQSGSEEPVLRALLEHGADPNLADMNGRTPLHNHPEYARLLLWYGADPTARDRLGNTPLHYLVRRYLRIAVYGDCERALEPALLLLEAGADPRAKNLKGETPLDLAGPEARKCFSQMFTYFARIKAAR